MNDKRYENTDFWKFLLEILAPDEENDKDPEEEKPKEEVKPEKKEEKEEKKEKPKNTNSNLFDNSSLTATTTHPVDLDWLLKPEKHKSEPEKQQPSKDSSCLVDIAKLWDLHKSLSETVKCMNELCESMKSESARWMKLKDSVYSCNSCGKYFTQEYNYCPNCGRKMYKSMTNGMIFGA